ncbi:phosphatase [Rossellomorea marisflavi]|uniref:phosphatase n=1 Tax=Rossellomorea marisflavi TaxID=189381 RepID=UPI0028534BC6|nr:phosphatase [Rossellomorea marisflavi]MDR4938161.1 phosphatase [Rossellomorea marisflavi]
MKKLATGLVLILSSSVLYGSTLITAAIYSTVLSQEGFGWDSRYGVFGTAFWKVGTVPVVVSTILAVVGIGLTAFSFYRKKL